MHAILCPMGSHGDVHPFIAVGKVLQKHGHRVTINTSPNFEELVLKNGFEFAPVGTKQDYQDMIYHPDLWHPTKAMRVLFGGEVFERMLRESYQNIVARLAPDTVVLAGSLGLSGRVAHEKHGVAYLTVHLQPAAMLSVHEPPQFSTGSIPKWFPHWLRRVLFWYADRRMLDPMLMPPVNRLRAELGLTKPIKRVFGPWRDSPQGILAFYPAWYSSPPDLPKHLTHVGFVNYDQQEQPMPEAVEKFLATGPKPVVVSFGSAMRQGLPYFTAAVLAFQKLGIRGMILAKAGEQIPANLPPSILQVDYAPFSLLLPRCAAVIHHGGIGTAAQSLAAGIPQLIMPMAFDQPDNAHRLKNFGVASVLKPAEFTPDNVARVLQTMLSSEVMQQKATEFAGKMGKESDAERVLLEAIERVLVASRNRV
jgi:rhamnosyltransferase subunit B